MSVFTQGRASWPAEWRDRVQTLSADVLGDISGEEIADRLNRLKAATVGTVRGVWTQIQEGRSSLVGQDLFGQKVLGQKVLGQKEDRLDALPALAKKLRGSQQALLLSSASAGLVVLGTVFSSPLLAVAGLPPMILVFWPTWRTAYTTLRQERRITSTVLDATRFVVCIGAGLYTIGALNALLQSIGQRRLIQSEADFERAIYDLLQHPRLADLDETARQQLADGLRAVAHARSVEQEQGERSGAFVAPLMLAACAVMTPFWGINRAASFLCTSFGGQMVYLGPLAEREVVGSAAEAGVLVRDEHALARLSLVSALVIDASVLADEAHAAHLPALIAHLHRRQERRQRDAELFARPLAVYVISEVEEGSEVEGESEGKANIQQLTQTLAHALTDLSITPSVQILPRSSESQPCDLAKTIEMLQSKGAAVAYVGQSGRRGGESSMTQATMTQATLAISVGGDPIDSPAHLSLVGGELDAIIDLFALADDVAQQRQFSLRVPILLDLIDVSTTVFLHLGLFYSTLFNYGGLLLGIQRTRQKDGPLSRLRDGFPTSRQKPDDHDPAVAVMY